MAAARSPVGPDAWDQWEAGVRALYDQMARIVIEPTWAKLLDFETTIPSNVEDLIREKMERGYDPELAPHQPSLQHYSAPGRLKLKERSHRPRSVRRTRYEHVR